MIVSWSKKTAIKVIKTMAETALSLIGTNTMGILRFLQVKTEEYTIL